MYNVDAENESYATLTYTSLVSEQVLALVCVDEDSLGLAPSGFGNLTVKPEALSFFLIFVFEFSLSSNDL